MNIIRCFLFSLFVLGSNVSIRSMRFMSPKVIYTRTMTNEWATICLPFNITVRADDNYTLYNMKSVSEKSVFLESYSVGAVVFAGTPCLIHKEGSLELRIEQDSVEVCFDSNLEYTQDGLSAKGTYTKCLIDSDNAYYMAKNMLWKKTEGSPLVVKPFCAWFEFQEPYMLNSRFYNICLTSPQYVDVECMNKEGKESVRFYDISGLNNYSLHHGFNIVVTEEGAKKVYIK